MAVLSKEMPWATYKPAGIFSPGLRELTCAEHVNIIIRCQS
jgi:hypothetical protein